MPSHKDSIIYHMKKNKEKKKKKEKEKRQPCFKSKMARI